MRSHARLTWNPYPPLPIGAIKDLLGITRALYRFTVETDPKDVVKLQELTDIGRAFRAALLQAKAPPGTIDHSNARGAAERATRALGALVQGAGLEPIVSAAAARIVGVKGRMANY